MSQPLHRPASPRRNGEPIDRRAVLTGSAIGLVVGLILTAALQFLLPQRRPEAARRARPVRPAHNLRNAPLAAGRGSPRYAKTVSADRQPLARQGAPVRVEQSAPAPAAEHGPRPSRPAGGSLDAGIRSLAWEAERSGLADYVGIYVARAVPGSRPIAKYRSDEDFPAASVIKVPVMLAVEQNWSKQPERRTRSRIKLLERMMRQSDNDAANALIKDLGGFDVVNAQTCRILGVAQTTTRLASYLRSVGGGSKNPKNRACPSEVGELLSTISERDNSGDSQAREMLEIMRQASAEHRTRIPQGVPAEYRDLVANKTGTLMTYRVTNDAAVIETPDGSRYVLCVFMEGVHRVEAADAFCTKVSHLCWIALSGPGLTAASAVARPRQGSARQATQGSDRKGKPKLIAGGSSKERSGTAEANAGTARRRPASGSEGPPRGKGAAIAANGPKLDVAIETDNSSGDR